MLACSNPNKSCFWCAPKDIVICRRWVGHKISKTSQTPMASTPKVTRGGKIFQVNGFLRNHFLRGKTKTATNLVTLLAVLLYPFYFV